MYKIGAVLILCLFVACNDRDGNTAPAEDGNTFNREAFTAKFTETNLPYILSDTGLLQGKDTSGIRNTAFAAMLPDSLRNPMFGTASDIRYTALAHFKEKNGTGYYVVRGEAGKRRAAILYVFEKNGDVGAAFPFLIPDADDKTTQLSTVDRSFSITRSINRKLSNDVNSDQKDVHIYNSAMKNFTLIMTDAPDDTLVALINPVDTLKKTGKFAGDYTKGKRNLVSIRDGRNAAEITFFVHFEKDGDCTGELKGTALFTASNTAVYRQPGSPCQLEFHFSVNNVTLKEIEGCGSFRGARCLFEGSYSRKSAAKPAKSTGKKTGQRSSGKTV